MKNFTLSVAAAFAMSTFAVAGGDIAPVEPMIEEVAPVVDDSGFYIGGAYSMATTSTDWQWGYDGTTYEMGSFDNDSSAFMLQAGYQFNKYIAIEGRYWNNLTSENGSGSDIFDDSWSWDYDYPEMDAYGIYVKPMYPVTEALTVYGLLGYGSVETGKGYYDWWDDAPKITLVDESGFQWGLGASYAMTENISLFVDYVQLATGADGNSYVDPYGFYDDPQNYYGETWESDVYTINFGLTYKF